MPQQHTLCVYQNILSDVLCKSFCILVQVVNCIFYLLLSVVTHVNEAVKLKYLFRVMQSVMIKHPIELGEIILD